MEPLGLTIKDKGSYDLLRDRGAGMVVLEETSTRGCLSPQPGWENP